MPKQKNHPLEVKLAFISAYKVDLVCDLGCHLPEPLFIHL